MRLDHLLSREHCSLAIASTRKNLKEDQGVVVEFSKHCCKDVGREGPTDARNTRQGIRAKLNL